MLTLTLKAGQKLHIGDDVTVQFMRKVDQEGMVRKKLLAVAVDAPKEVTILRSELVDTSD